MSTVEFGPAEVELCQRVVGEREDKLNADGVLNKVQQWARGQTTEEFAQNVYACVGLLAEMTLGHTGDVPLELRRTLTQLRSGSPFDFGANCVLFTPPPPSPYQVCGVPYFMAEI